MCDEMYSDYLDYEDHDVLLDDEDYEFDDRVEDQYLDSYDYEGPSRREIEKEWYRVWERGVLPL